jgi:hypothetical protein
MAGFILIGKMLIMIGAILLLLGLIMTFGSKIPWIGRLPGDIIIKKDHFSFYFPFTSCIIVSISLTLLFYSLRR